MVNNMGWEKYEVWYDGKIINYVNPRLVRSQNIDDETLEKIKETHVLRYRLFKMAEENLDNPSILKELAKDFDDLEYKQQELWGFPKDHNYHRFFDFPGCACPKMDNEERLGYGNFIINMECPIHRNK
jgi:hypothetical protein